MTYYYGQKLYGIKRTKGLWQVNDIPLYFLEQIDDSTLLLQYAERRNGPFSESAKAKTVQKQVSEVFLDSTSARLECEQRNALILCI